MSWMVPFCTPVRARVAGVGHPIVEEERNWYRLRIYGHWASVQNMLHATIQLGNVRTPQVTTMAGDQRMSRIPKLVRTPIVTKVG